MASSPSDEDWKKVTKLVDQFMNRPDTEPFREPVDWKALGLFDYPKIVPEPMDLGTVKKKLQKKEYKTLQQVGLDVRKIWSNCQDYNQEGSDFHKLAGTLRKRWDDKFTKLVADSRSATTTSGTTSAGDAPRDVEATPAAPPPPSQPPISTLAERKSFAKSLFALTKEDLGKLLVEIEAKCPSALTRNAAEDEVEVNVDKLSSALLLELSVFVASTTQKPPKASNSKKGGSNSNKRAKTNPKPAASAASN